MNTDTQTQHSPVQEWLYNEAYKHDASTVAIMADLKAHADKLAEALRAWEYAGNEGGISMVDWFEVARNKTRAALAEYELST